ncbi:hypothetical protein K3495_g6431 [Podosphaera aphanis]|nr:hypothetical protein K3495_g6431 [Podosphaera aphanis]
MTDSGISLSWTAVFSVASTTRASLSGDKIILPQSALEQLLAASASPSQSLPSDNKSQSVFDQTSISQRWETRQQLPHPLTFRLVNARNGKHVYAGILEFSATEGEVELSPFLLKALEIIQFSSVNSQESSNNVPNSPLVSKNHKAGEELPCVTIHAQQIPKGEYVRLRPLEPGYNPDNWKPLLEKHLRENFTTLTLGELLTVNVSKIKEYKFLIDKVVPQGKGICVVDIDLEVDIEALDEEQARETLKQITSKSQENGVTGSSHAGGEISMWKPFKGQISEGSYVDFTLSSWDRSRGIVIEVDGESVDLLASPYSSRQRAKPREDEHVWGDFSTEAKKKIIVTTSSTQSKDVEAIFISLHIRDGNPGSHMVSLQIQPLSLESPDNPIKVDQEQKINFVGEERCMNCLKWIPKCSITLHENFCRRNNILCPHCQNVYHKNSQEWQNHWHCEFDSAFGQTPMSKTKHYEIFHTPRTCHNCNYKAKSLKDLAAHRTSFCPSKIILCQFCHLEVPQEGDLYDPSPEVLVSGLTAHELADGARTTNCHLCSKITRLRDMPTHLKHHELDKYKKPKPRICKNVNCGRTLDVIQKNGTIVTSRQSDQSLANTLGLCGICFGPLYANLYDPEGKALKRRVERLYLKQLIAGCGKSWCHNLYCKTAQKSQLTSKTAMPTVKLLIENLDSGPLHFCVNEDSQKRRELASQVAAGDKYDLEWCLAALQAEEGNLEGALTWLSKWAPEISKEPDKV